jgi:hypothetical protein
VIIVREFGPFEIALKVDSVADFAAAHLSQNDIEGPPLSLYRWLVVTETDHARLAVVERHGNDGLSIPLFDANKVIARVANLEGFRARRREFGDDAAGFQHASELIDNAFADGLDPAVVCDLFFAAEREFWMRRNRAAQVQYARQQFEGFNQTGVSEIITATDPCRHLAGAKG